MRVALNRKCEVCGGPMPDGKRVGTKYCGSRCRERAKKRNKRRSPDRFKLTHAQVSAKMRSQRDKCAGCGKSIMSGDFHLDHIVPRAKGGPSTFENCQLLCPACNLKKSDSITHLI